MYSKNDYRYYLENRLAQSDDFLAHYGVQGMHWGVRKDAYTRLSDRKAYNMERISQYKKKLSTTGAKKRAEKAAKYKIKQDKYDRKAARARAKLAAGKTISKGQMKKIAKAEKYRNKVAKNSQKNDKYSAKIAKLETKNSRIDKKITRMKKKDEKYRQRELDQVKKSYDKKIASANDTYNKFSEKGKTKKALKAKEATKALKKDMNAETRALKKMTPAELREERARETRRTITYGAIEGALGSVMGVGPVAAANSYSIARRQTHENRKNYKSKKQK